jgi:hypothetical protein
LPRKGSRHSSPRLASRKPTVRLVGLACRRVQRRNRRRLRRPVALHSKASFFFGDRGDSSSLLPERSFPPPRRRRAAWEQSVFQMECCCCTAVMMKYKQDTGNNCYERSANTVQTTIIAWWFWLFWIFAVLVQFHSCWRSYSDQTRSNDAPASPDIHVSGRDPHSATRLCHSPNLCSTIVYWTYWKRYCFNSRETTKHPFNHQSKNRKMTRSFAIEASCEIIPASVMSSPPAPTPPTSVLILWDHHHPP